MIGVETVEFVDMIALARIALTRKSGKRGGIVKIVGLAPVCLGGRIGKARKESILFGIVQPEKAERPPFGVLAFDQAVKRTLGILSDGVEISIGAAVIGKAYEQRIALLVHGKAEVVAPHDQYPGGVHTEVAMRGGKITFKKRKIL